MAQPSSPDDPEVQARALALTNQAIQLAQKFGRTGAVSDINESVTLLKEAIALTPERHPDLAKRLNVLGIVLKRRFARLANFADIQAAIEYQERSCRLVAADDKPGRSMFLNNLANSLSIRFQRTADIEDIERSVSCLREAVDLTPADAGNLPSMLANLGGSLKVHFEHTGVQTYIDDAVLSLRQAIDLTPGDDAERMTRLNTLGEALGQRFDRFGDISDIQESISFLQSSVQLVPPQHAFLPHALNSLVKVLLARYERLGDIADLQQLIISQQRAIHLTPEDHPSLSSYHNTLGYALAARFHRLGDLRDLEQSVASARTAVSRTPDGSPDLPSSLNSLGSSLISLFENTENASDIFEAVTVLRNAVTLTSSTSPELHVYLSNLGIALTSLFEETNRSSYIDEAITSLQRAVHLIPFDHPNHPNYLHHLASSHVERFQVSTDPADLETAISTFDFALTLLPEGAPFLGLIAISLGSALVARFRLGADKQDLHAAASHFRAIATSPTCSPRRRVKAASLLAGVSKMLGNKDDALDAYDIAITLTSLVAELGRQRQSQHRDAILGNTLSLAAASMAIEFGQIEKALGWLEQGRCLLWQELRSSRTPVGLLEVRHPDLSTKFVEISQVFEDLGSGGALTTTRDFDSRLKEQIKVEENSRKYIDLAKERDALLVEIRSKEGFGDFLLPPPITSILQRLPKNGVTVVLNIHDRRCDAIVLGFADNVNPKPQLVPLPNFTVNQGEKLYRDLSECLLVSGSRTRGDKRTAAAEEGPRGMRPAVRQQKAPTIMEGVLKQLWDCVIKPVIDFLKLTPQEKMDQKTRIWWCVTGPLAFLPIHAAGAYGVGSTFGDRLVDYTISSFIPTLTSLSERTESAGRSIAEGGLLLVSQANTPGLTPLPGTAAEIKAIRKIVDASTSPRSSIPSKGKGPDIVHLDGPAATVSAVAEKLAHFGVVHLACHAERSPENALQSKFHLHDGHLTLSSIIQRRQGGKSEDGLQATRAVTPSLAFLSACQTSAGNERLSEEALHLAAGMLAAGYRGVVGTMWSIPDAYAPGVAEEFYQRLLGAGERESGEEAGLEASAYALHCAVEKLRSQLGHSEEAFLSWVPYVHFGI